MFPLITPPITQLFSDLFMNLFIKPSSLMLFWPPSASGHYIVFKNANSYMLWKYFISQGKHGTWFAYLDFTWRPRHTLSKNEQWTCEHVVPNCIHTHLLQSVNHLGDSPPASCHTTIYWNSWFRVQQANKIMQFLPCTSSRTDFGSLD